jgi:hypothetical protein
MFQTKLLEKIKTRIPCSVDFFSENRNIYEIRPKNVVEPEGPQTSQYGACALHDE